MLTNKSRGPRLRGPLRCLSCETHRHRGITLRVIVVVTTIIDHAGDDRVVARDAAFTRVPEPRSFGVVETPTELDRKSVV